MLVHELFRITDFGDFLICPVTINYLLLVSDFIGKCIIESTLDDFSYSVTTGCLKFKSVQADENDCTLYKRTTRNAMNFRHLFSCGTIVSIL